MHADNSAIWPLLELRLKSYPLYILSFLYKNNNDNKEQTMKTKCKGIVKKRLECHILISTDSILILKKNVEILAMIIIHPRAHLKNGQDWMLAMSEAGFLSVQVPDEYMNVQQLFIVQFLISTSKSDNWLKSYAQNGNKAKFKILLRFYVNDYFHVHHYRGISK